MNRHAARWLVALIASCLMVLLLTCIAAPSIHDGHLPPFSVPFSFDQHHTLVFRNAIDCHRDLAHPNCNAGNASYQFSILYRQDGYVSVLASYRQ